ncbi:MAG: helix-turn-helix transcriptional regulator [Deltaproteobacteria bacterium]|nr:helix-turn-helix transcriptional regulator [Deltaproteobacteria bacterium]
MDLLMAQAEKSHIKEKPKPKPKYDSWGTFLRINREKLYRSARDFCNKINLGISYPQYSRYEAGEQLPNLNQALFLCQNLDIQYLEGFFQWSLSQISDAKMKEDISKQLVQLQSNNNEKSNGLDTDSALSSDSLYSTTILKTKKESFLMDNVFVFNRSHRELFEVDPYYRDIFTYVNSFGPDLISINEVAMAHGLPIERTKKMLDDLVKLGVMERKDSQYKALKRVLYFPDDEDFFMLRNKTFLHNVHAIFNKIKYQDLAARQGYRTVVTRKLDLDQIGKLFSLIDELILRAADFPETKNEEKMFSLCVLLGERFTRPKLRP